PGQQHFQAVGEAMAVRDSAFVSFETRYLTGEFASKALHRASLAGDDIDHPKKCVVAIQHRGGPAHYFNPIDQIHVEQEFRADVRAIGQIVVHTMAVHQQEHAAVEIATAYSTRSQ